MRHLPIIVALSFAAGSCGCPDLFGNHGDDDERAECGDREATGREACDGRDLRGEDCASLGFGDGTLSCLATCADFDRSGCGAPESCGDDAVQEPEVCDGADLGGASCDSLGFGGGVLRCAANCGNFDVAACAPPDGCEPACGAAVCGVDPVCGTSCGSCDAGFACVAGACELIPRCTEEDDRVAICEGGACALDLDVPLFDVATQVRVDGAQPQNVFGGFGEVTARFTDTTTRVTYSFPFEGDVSRQTFLVPGGTFDVDLIVNEQSAVPGAPTGTPLRAATHVAVTADRTLDLDVALLDVATQVRVNGAQPLNVFGGFGEVSVRFTDRATGVVYTYAFEGDVARETFLVPAGAFDVDLVVNEASAVPGAPTGTALRAAEDVTVNADRTLDLDVSLFDVATQVRIDGRQPLNVFGGFGEVTARFTDTATGVAYAFPFEGDVARETFLVPRGVFDVDLVVNEASAVPGAPTGTPLRAAESVTVEADGTLDLDVPLFDVATQVRIDGRQPQNVFGGFGEVTARFTDADTGVAYSFPFEGDVARETFLVPGGVFDIDLIVNEASAVPGAPTGTPLRANAGVAIAGDGSLDLDVPLFDVATQVRIDGVAPLNVFGGFGEVTARFTDTATGVAYSFPFEGDVARETFLVPRGTFDVDLVVNEASAAPGAPTGTPLRARDDVAVQADGSLDLDVPLFDVDTRVRIDGLAPLNVFGGFGEVTARFTDTATGVAYPFPFEGDAPRAIFLVPGGVFDVDLIVNEASAVPGAPTGTPLRAAECVVVE